MLVCACSPPLNRWSHPSFMNCKVYNSTNAGINKPKFQFFSCFCNAVLVFGSLNTYLLRMLHILGTFWLHLIHPRQNLFTRGYISSTRSYISSTRSYFSSTHGYISPTIGYISSPEITPHPH